MIPTDHDLSALLTRLAQAFGPRPAVIGETHSFTFAELDAAATRWARQLVASGYGPGSHIGLLAGNGPDWLAVAFGVWRAGATLVPISTFVTASELGDILAHADVALLIAHPRLERHDYVAHLQSLPHLQALRATVLLSEQDESDFTSARAWLHDDLDKVALPAIEPSAVACILYTSGTTGRPKGVMLTHGSILSTVPPTAERGGLDATDLLLSTLPLFWVAGLVIRALPTLASGSGLVLQQTFDAAKTLAALRQHPITALHLRPPQVGQLLGHADFHADSLAHIRKGGGRTAWYAPHLRDAHLITGYGMTEMSGYVTALHWQDPPEVRDTQIGTPLPGVEMRIAADDEGDGEVLVRGPGLFHGYYKESADAIDAARWFHTGDLGRLDAHGMFHFAGRSKDLLRVKGINVSPVEVESVLALHPQVEAAYVVGLPADGLEQEVVALLIWKGERVDDDGLRAFAAQRLSSYKRPSRYINIGRQDVPLSGTSKPQRVLLAQLAQKRLAAALQ